jgi:hypothetical protein
MKVTLIVCFSPINTTIKDYNDTLYLNFHCMDMQINLYGDSKPVVYEGVSNCNVPSLYQVMDCLQNHIWELFTQIQQIKV